MSSFDPRAFGAVFAPLLEFDRRRSLNAGAPDLSARRSLERLNITTAFCHRNLADRNAAECCISAVWLLYDFLDESHAISQRIETPSGSFWHGIMHRREGDFSNAKYWFRRVGNHPLLGLLRQLVADLAATGAAEAVATIGSTCDPFRFVDLCQAAAHGRSQIEPICRDIQQAEWELLFTHCYRMAIGE